MKKIISLLLSVLMIFSLVSVGASAATEEKELKAVVVNDLHYNPTYGNYAGTAYKEADYSHVPNNGQLWIESLLIVETFLDEIAKSDCDIVLIPGDLTDHGNTDEHTAFAQILTKFENDTGKRVYVVPGNHDYFGDKGPLTPEAFANFYKNFGYGEAIATDPNSASYVAELDDDYRLLAIDSCVPGKSNSGLSEDRKDWILQQAEKAQKDGKKLVSMMHHNLLNHFIFGEIFHPGGFVSSDFGLPEIFSQYNIKYTFTGHTHAQDIKAYTGKNGVTIYDVLTSSINLYPLPYRTVTFGENVEIKTDFLETIDMTSKQDVLSDNCYNLAVNDFQSYALACSNYGLDLTVERYVNTDLIIRLLKLDRTEDADLCSIIDKLVPMFLEILETPLYIKDASGGASIEAAAEELNLELPETNHKNFKELGFFLYQQYVLGDENFGLISSEYLLLTASLSTIFNMLLASISGEDYAKLLNYLTSYLGLKIPEDFSKYAGDAVSRIKGIDLFVSALSSSVFLHFTTDDAPKDNNVTLPGYEETVIEKTSLSLFERIRNFFRNFFDYILRIFGIGK